MVVKLDIGKLGLVDTRILGRFLVVEHPQTHPHEAQTTDYDKGHLPAVAHTHVLEETGKRRY